MFLSARTLPQAIEYFAKKTIFDTAKFCHDAMKKDNPDPRVQKFCMFAKENPKKAVAVIIATSGSRGERGRRCVGDGGGGWWRGNRIGRSLNRV